MSAKSQALKDIKEYLTPIADSDMVARKQASKRWLPYANIYTYDAMRDSYELRISHITNPFINLVSLTASKI